MVLGSAWVSILSKQTIWLQTSKAPAKGEAATEASLPTEESKGRLERPRSFQF